MKNALWQTVLGEIELSVSRGSFVTWFKNTELLENEAGRVVIGVPNIFAKQQFEAKFNDAVTKTLVKNGVKVELVEYVIGSVAKRPKPPTDSGPFVSQSVQESTQSPVQNTSNKSGLNPKYIFKSFIVGSGNELAYTASQAVAKNPGDKYNPLFLYGGVGLGKTHLMQAVGNAVAKRQPNAKILYISTETFVNEFLDCIRYKRKFDSNRYRSVDVLIIDDMQFIAGKERTQEEFFHTFNALHQANKQIVISSDKPPKAIPNLEERLRSRFEMGMSIDIQSPDFETRCAILQIKASQNGIKLSQETVEYLAGSIQNNVRELEGALNQLLAFCEMRGVEPDIAMAKGVVGGSRGSRPHSVSARQIIERCAKHFQIEPTDIVSPRRDKHIVVPRQIAMYLLRTELHLSFPKIAVELGRKDHTTAIHSVDKIEKSMKLDYIIRQQVTEIRDGLYG